MHMLIKGLSKVASRYAPSRPISFDVVHIFKTLQMIESGGHASRASLGENLALGQGVIRTLIRHMKAAGLIATTNGGTKMTRKGVAVHEELVRAIAAETPLSNSRVAVGKFNYAVLLKSLAYGIKSGIEQRDAAIKMGGTGATTLVFRDSQFVMPNSNKDSLRDEDKVRRTLLEKLRPEDGDVIIIGTSDNSAIIAELAAKHAALFTLKNHEKHA
jgi:hypothetical protein